MAAKAFDEMNSGAADSVRAPYRGVADWLARTSPEKVAATRHEVDLFYRRHGITFGAYGAVDGAETTIPFDIIPRVIAWDEWEYLHKGLVQRVRALNAFLADAYGEREICRAGVIPEQQVLMNAEFVAMAQGLELPGGVHAHIAGIDLVRVGEKDFYVLEDNVRTPSGVSYVLENREVMMRLAPELFSAMRVLPVADYSEELLATLRSVSFSDDAEPNVVLLTPGHFNSAYFEHAFLADEMGIELVEGSDLFVDEGRVYMRTPRGPQRVDVIYRRVDDAFLDPLAMRPDSYLGVAGLLGALRAGRVNIVNALGNGVADDKSTYTYVPEMVRFYLGEEPILAQRADLALRPGRRLQVRARAAARTGRQGNPRLGRQGHAGRADLEQGRDRGVHGAAEGAARQLHRPADPGALDLSDLRRPGRGAAPCRSAALRAVGPQDHHHSRRAHARGAEGRLAGRQFEPGRRHQGHLGAGAGPAAGG